MLIPTRMELTRLSRRLVTARRGHKLLKDKRDELMRQFLILAKQAMELRVTVEARLAQSAMKFALARSLMDPSELESALLAPGRRLTAAVSERNVMSVRVPRFTFTPQPDAGSYARAYGYAFTNASLDEAVAAQSAALPIMLELAEVEKACELMSEEIEKTRRRVNALEYVMIPNLQRDIRYIAMKLDENERGAQVRLMKVKDMMLEEAHGYKQRAGE